MVKKVSKAYGEALFELCMEQHQEDKGLSFFQEVLEVSNILKENLELDKLMLHPGISKSEKAECMESIFKGHICQELLGFFMMIIEKDRYAYVQHILQYFIEKYKKEIKLGVAYVTSANELTAEQKAAIEERLLETTEYEKMELHFAVDQALIGGLVIRIGDRVVDSSIQTKLERLKKELLQIQLG